MSSNKPKAVPVSELFDHLVVEYRAGGPPHSILFQTALRVCADEAKRVQRGEPPSSLRALAQRAHALIKDSYPASTPASLAAGPGLQTQGEAAPVRFTGRPAYPPPTESGATEPSVVRVPAALGSPQPTGTPAPPPVAATPPIPAPPALPSTPGKPATEAAHGAAGEKPTAPTPVSPTPEEGPFEEAPASAASGPSPTFVTLEDAPFQERPREKPPAPTPTPSGAIFEDLLPAEEPPEAQPEFPSEHRGLQVVGRIALIGLALLAAAVAVVILWPGVSRRQPVSSRIVESFPAPTPTVPAADLAAALRAPVEPTATAVPALLIPSPAPKPAAPSVRVATPHQRRPAPVEAAAGVETMRSPDWTGREPVFVVHFSSYRSRENATSDAARLARELGRPVHAVTVDLGDKGTWYRVVVGDFATVDEARAFRAEIAVRRPGEVSGVFRLAAQ